VTSKLDELEQRIIADMRKVYSQKAIDHAMNPQNVGHIKDADGYARVTGSCGDTMEISLKMKRGKVLDAKFWTDGCGTSIACGSVTTELIKGKSVAGAQKVDSKFILNTLEGLPESNVHCAVLASDTLRAAIKNYLASIRAKVK
jgi:nitrogen fixation NifU-like protein